MIKAVCGQANKWQVQDININNNILNQIDVYGNLHSVPNPKYSYYDTIMISIFPFLSSWRKKKNIDWQLILSVILPVFIIV